MPSKWFWAIFLVLISIYSIPPSEAAYLEQYKLSPAIRPGLYALYEVLYHPSIEQYKIVVMDVRDGTQVRINLTLTYYTHTVKSVTEWVSVAQAPSPVPTEGMPFLPSSLGPDGVGTALTFFPDLFAVPFPIISPYLHVNDFVNLDQRRSTGLVINRAGGEVLNYSFRRALFAGVETPIVKMSFEWDAETGLLLNYQNTAGQPQVARLVATNAWGNPVYNFRTDLMAVPGFVFGAYFSHWELWVITASAILLYFVVIPWARKYVNERGTYNMNPKLVRALSEIEKQDKSVKTVVI